MLVRIIIQYCIAIEGNDIYGYYFSIFIQHETDRKCLNTLKYLRVSLPCKKQVYTLVRTRIHSYKSKNIAEESVKILSFSFGFSFKPERADV